MKILLATSNADKVKEIKKFFAEYEIYALGEVLDPFEMSAARASNKTRLSKFAQCKRR